MTCYPWQQEQWQSLAQQVKQERLPHALLLTGPKGLGKLHFAQHLAQALLCQQGSALQSCGQCQSCHLFIQGNHPDFFAISPNVAEEGKRVAKEIKIDQIRQLCRELAFTSQYGGYKISIVYPAERMTLSAANSILKTLEEPTERTLLILIAEFAASLLPTIRSRCQQIEFSLPTTTVAQRWLKQQQTDTNLDSSLTLAGGAPLLALQAYAEDWALLQHQLYSQLLALAAGETDIVEATSALSQHQQGQLIDWLIVWANDLVRAVIAPETGLANTAFSNAIKQLVPRINLAALYTWYDQLLILRRALQSSSNWQQGLESQLILWLDVVSLAVDETTGF